MNCFNQYIEVYIYIYILVVCLFYWCIFHEMDG